jgi:hypothetical protein
MDGVYCLGNEKMLCHDFVCLVGGRKEIDTIEDEIRVTVSDNLLEGALVLWVRKEGYYRWSWTFDDGYCLFYNQTFGVYQGVEEVLKDFFPDAREDGLDKARRLWIAID